MNDEPADAAINPHLSEQEIADWRDCDAQQGSADDPIPPLLTTPVIAKFASAEALPKRDATDVAPVRDSRR